jgi:hypothetical protein
MDVFLILFACLVAPFTPAKDTTPPIVGVYHPPAQRVDYYDAKSTHVGWGRVQDGRTDYFTMNGQRIGWSQTTGR